MLRSSLRRPARDGAGRPPVEYAHARTFRTTEDDSNTMPIDAGIPFWKMSGSGNDFLVIDNRAGIVPPAEAGAFARAVSRPRLSVGADGVVLIERSDEPGIAFRWRYVNADGSDGELCGNGAMCGARFAALNGIAPRVHRFRTASGIVQAWVSEDDANPRVRIAIADPGPLRPAVTLAVGGRELTLHPIAVGVPHAVIVTDDVDAFAPGEALEPLGRALRHHPAFAPAGTNVDIVAVRDRRTVRMRTYERGVEAETLACGTGAVASAIVATAFGLVEPPVDVVTSSGRVLAVGFVRQNERITGVTLGGEARIVVRGAICPEALI